MTHDRAIELALLLLAAGYAVNVTLTPQRLPVDVRTAGTPAAATVHVLADQVGRRLTVDDVVDLRHLLADQGARGEIDQRAIVVLDA